MTDRDAGVVEDHNVPNSSNEYGRVGPWFESPLGLRYCLLKVRKNTPLFDTPSRSTARRPSISETIAFTTNYKPVNLVYHLCMFVLYKADVFEEIKPYSIHTKA